MKEITLPSGATLKITLSSFSVSKNLFQAVLEEVKAMKMDPESEIDVNLFKDMFCSGFSSKKIEACLAECMKRVLYNDLKITEDTFEPEEARQDYLMACWEVVSANVMPFTKALTSNFSAVLGNLKSSLA